MPATSNETPRMRCSPPNVLNPGLAGSGTRALVFVISNSAADNANRSSCKIGLHAELEALVLLGIEKHVLRAEARPVVRNDKLCDDGLNAVLAAR